MRCWTSKINNLKSKLVRTNSKHIEFINLVEKLDAELAIRDGDDHDFYHQFNSISSLQYVVVLFINNEAIGCGAIKPFEQKSMEIKRMYVLPEHRGYGYASVILNELECWANELQFEYCVLETGINQPEAIALYQKNGYQRITNFGQYQGVKNSYCFEKELTK